MKILITGINGFIGLSISESLSLSGENWIIGTDVADSYKGTNRIDYIKADLGSDTFLPNIFEKIQQCDVIIHVAADMDKNLFTKSLIQVNCGGAQKVLEMAERLGCKKIIYISGTTVIGKPIILPVTEEHPTAPETTYHASKLFGEHMLAMGSKLGIKTIILRLSAPIGHSMPNNRMLKQIIMNCIKNKDILVYGKGNRKQNYVDVRDVGAIISSILPLDVEGVFNIGSNKSYTNLEVINMCTQLIATSSNIVFSEIPDPEEDYCWDISIDKAKKILGYNPQYELKDTIIDIKNSLVDEREA